MEYDGIVTKILQDDEDYYYLFLVDPVKKVLVDGVNISEHKAYDDLTYDQLMVVSVELKDGTKILENIDLEDFVHNEKFGKYDIFIYIKDLLLFTIGDHSNLIKLSISNILEKGEFNDVALNCIERTKEELKKIKK